MGTKTIRVFSAGLHGLDARLIEVQVAPARSQNHFQIIGLPDSAVKESTHRVLTALISSDLPIPKGPVIVNLAPASTRKQGSMLDLPVALGVAALGGAFKEDLFQKTIITGELSLDGKVRPAGGGFLVGILGSKLAFERVICPLKEAREIKLASPQMEIWGVSDLLEAALLITGKKKPSPVPEAKTEPCNCYPDLAEVKGQRKAIRALIISAAGNHHVLMTGPPGSGKSFLAVRLPGILPPLLPGERIEVTKIRSAAGLPVKGLETQRPFRSPHHTISYAGLVGGGADPKPGEITLAHRGVLFLDELPEFERKTLEVLRQPLEQGSVNIGRAKAMCTFPAKFLLVAAMNPCPCGFQGHPFKPCRCTPRTISRYRARVSGPLLDRLDIRVWVPPVQPEELISLGRNGTQSPFITSSKAKEMVMAARERQRVRFKGKSMTCNSEIPSSKLEEYAGTSIGGRKLLLHALKNLGLSARGLVRVRRVARTIADLDDSDVVTENHVLEALAYRGEETYLAL